MNKTEILENYLTMHNALGTRKDALDKDEFDGKHSKIWTDYDVELTARKEELRAKSVPSKVEREELSELKVMLPDPSPPSRDLAAEITMLTERIKLLERGVR